MRAVVKRCVSNQWIRMTVAMLGFGLFAIALRYLAGLGPAEAIYASTGGAVVWYTVETYRLRKEMVRQNEIAIHPLVIATVESRQIRHDQWGLRVVLRNIGRGPALFVRVDEFGVEEIKEERTKLFSTIPPVDCIEPGKDEALPVEAVIEAQGREFYRDAGTDRINYVAMLHPESATKTYYITVRYEDIDRLAYWAKVQMGKGGIRLLDHGQERRS